jgi:tetratricopeptide (TPR) repeat protein
LKSAPALALLALLALLAAAASGCAGMGSMSDQEVRTYGDEAFHREDYRRAVTFYSELSKRGEADAAVYARRGVSFERLGEPGQARTDLGRAVDLDPASALPRLYRANLEVKQGDATAAEADVAALEAMPLRGHDRVAALVLRGTVLQARGDLPRAVVAYDQAAEEGRRGSGRLVRGHYQDALYNASGCYYRMGAFDRAATVYGELVATKAQARQAITADDHYAMGLLLYLSGDFQGAGQHFEHVPPERRARAAEVLNDQGFFASAR